MNTIENGNFILFAVDSNFLRDYGDLYLLRRDSGIACDGIANWFPVNQFKLNSDKTQRMVFTLKHGFDMWGDIVK